jgi:hypothetical protein
MRVTYQAEIDVPATARARVFSMEAGDWPFPTLPAPGDGVVIDFNVGRVRAEQQGNLTAFQPEQSERLTAMRVERVTYRLAIPQAILHLCVDGLTHDPAGQIEALQRAWFPRGGSWLSPTNRSFVGYVASPSQAIHMTSRAP